MRKWMAIFLIAALAVCAGCAAGQEKEEAKDPAQVKAEALKYLETEERPRTNTAVMADGVHAAMRIGEDVAELQIICRSRQVSLTDETDVREVENWASETGSQIEFVEAPLEGYRFLTCEVSYGTDDFYFETRYLYENNFAEENWETAEAWADWDAGHSFFAETVRLGQLVRLAEIQVEEGQMVVGNFAWVSGQDNAAIRYGVMSANGVAWQEEAEEIGMRPVELYDPGTYWLFVENIGRETVDVYGKYVIEVWE